MNELIVKDLTVKWGDRTVLTDISFTVARHEMLAIVGPNGGGKSSLLRALLNLIPSQGTIDWHTQSIRYLPALDQINRKDLPPLTVGDFMGFKGHHPIDRLLIKVGLDPSIKTRYFHALSTGEFQRILLAWTLIGTPSVIVLDEPTAGLDIKGEHTIFSFLRSLNECTVIIATHHIHSALEYADHILCINQKQLCYGSQNEITMATIKQLHTGELHVH